MNEILAVRCPDIVCEGCANAIKQSLGRVAGVENVQVGVAEKSVNVTYDSGKTSESALRERLERAGFPPTSD
jgi:copper chaperone CopZ